MPNPAPTLPLLHPNARKRGAAGQGVSLLVWHDVIASEAERLVWFDTTVALFEKQLAQISKAGAKPISLTALHAYLAHGAAAPPPGAVVLCFDDNTSGILEHAAPRLQKRGWPFAVSAHTKFVGVQTSKSHNTWDELQQMEKMGGTIVSQTHEHPPDLRLLRDGPLMREMTESKRRMEAALNHTVPFLTYPSGKWDKRVALAAQSAGYHMALTEDFGIAETSPHLLGIHRFSTHRRFAEGIAAIMRSARH